MATIRRKTIIWSLFILASVGATFFSFRYFSRAFPIVNLDIRMSRTQALEHATELANQLNVGPSEYRQSALFASDSTVQTYVELEAGGAQAFNALVTGALYSPYTWQVRHFQPGQTNELISVFKPDGTPYGFVEKIAENTPGAALSPEQAESTARKQALEQWHINFAEYTRVEISKETKPNGRIDHTFVYERPDVRIGKATYRLRLVVSGDKLTTLAHFVKVPEEFIHHYQEMRSANNTVAHGAQLAMMLLYMVCIGMGGLYFLFRKKYLIWKIPLIWSFIVTTLTTCASISFFPLYWFFYNTTAPVNTFIINYLYMFTLGFVINLIINTAIFMIAESLTRMALPAQGQLWKTWSLSGGSSWQTIAQTISSYLLVPLYFADTVIFYMITMRYLGWWNPSEQLTDPNILASYAPWLNAVSKSLSAGFLEECLFRAFPLAAAILLGRRYGKEKWWIVGAFIIQILIFGAAHANYPTQPAYARLVELIAFSSIAGVIYLKCGLLVGIISHALYDLVWFALPLFISHAPYAWINQMIVIVIALLPLMITIIRRLQASSWHTLDTSDLNEAWQPQPTPEKAPRIIEQRTSTRTLSSNNFYFCIVAGIIGFTTWLTCTRFVSDAPALHTTRQEAEQTSHTTLAARNMAVNTNWTALSHVELFNSQVHKHALPGAIALDQHRFVYQNGGKELYKAMLGSYLQPAHWCTRLVTFNGSISDRAEEYFISQADSGILCVDHTLPEDRKGAQLTETEARVIAHKTLHDLYNREPETVQEISAVSSKRPDRLDWTFIFADPQQPLIDGGQARIAITVSGDQLTGNCRYIHVPEEWVRNQQAERATFGLINTMSISLLVILLLMACIFIFKGTRFSMPIGYMLLLFAALLAMNIASTLNTWPALMAQILNTQEPYAHQLFRLLSGMMFSLLFSAAAYSYIVAVTMMYARATRTNNNNNHDTFWGIALGLCWAGLTALLTHIQPALEPFWGDFSTLGSYCPACNVLIGNLIKCINQIVFILILVYAVDVLAKYKLRYLLQIAAMLLFGFALAGSQPLLTINHFILCGAVFCVFIIVAYYRVLAYVPSCAPWLVATMLSCQFAQQAVLNLYPTAMIANICSIIIVYAAAWLWHSIMIKSDNT